MITILFRLCIFSSQITSLKLLIRMNMIVRPIRDSKISVITYGKWEITLFIYSVISTRMIEYNE